MSDGFIKCESPKPTKHLSKNSVITAIAIFGILLTIAIVIGKGAREPKKAEASNLKAYPSTALSTLPSSYSEVKLPTPSPTSAPVQATQLYDADLMKLLAKMKEEKLKRADAARRSGIVVKSVSVETNNGRSFGMPTDINQTDQPSIPSSLNPRDGDNRQDEKRSFLESKKSDSTLLSQRIKSPVSPYQLMAGTVLPGIMITGINSDLPGEIMGQIAQDVHDSVKQSALLVPKGTKVLGQYDSRVVYGQERVLVVWTRLMFPNGKSISLEGMPGSDLSGYAGLSDQVNNHYMKLLTGVVFSSLLSAGAQVTNGNTYNTFDPRFSDLAVQGAARNINDVGQEITRKNLNIQPTLEIRPGFRFNVFVNKDMVLEPYTEKD